MRPRRLGAGLAVIVAIAVVIAIVLITQTPSSTPNAGAAARTSSGYATVRRRNLVATDTESGTLAYTGAHTVYDRLGGTITWLPGVGQLIKPGQVLFRVENLPVILMDGSTPAYRGLSSADSDGPDILELNRNLVRLGFNPYGIVEDDVWQPATTAGVDLLQASLGETETGELTLGQVVFLPGPQLVSTLDGTVGSTGGGSGGGAAASYDPPRSSTEFVNLTKPARDASTTAPPTGTTTTPTTTTATTTPGRTPVTHGKGGHPRSTAPSTQAIEQQIQAIVRALQAEARAGHGGGNPSSSGSGKSPSSSSNSPSSSSNGPSAKSSPSSASGGGGSATAILATTSDRLVVTVDLPASSQSEARVGAPVTVELPDSTSVPGRIRSVSPVAQSSSSSDNSSGGSGGSGGGGGGGGGGSSATVPVTIALTHRISGKGLDQAAVSVEFAQARANHVLSVPVTALVATSGNSYAVQEAAAPHKLIPVTTGLFAAGYVQISGPGIYSGLEVTDSQG